MPKLNAPRNYRETNPKCCVTCVHYVRVDSITTKGSNEIWKECERDGTGYSGEEDYFMVCDYYKLRKPTKKAKG